MSNEEETKAVEIMIEAAKDAEYIEDAMLLGYRALKEHKYPKPPEIDIGMITTTTIPREIVEQAIDMQRVYSARDALRAADEQAWRDAAARDLNSVQYFSASQSDPERIISINQVLAESRLQSRNEPSTRRNLQWNNWDTPF